MIIFFLVAALASLKEACTASDPEVQNLTNSEEGTNLFIILAAINSYLLCAPKKNLLQYLFLQLPLLKTDYNQGSLVPFQDNNQ